MASLSEHITAIKAAFDAAKEDGFTLEFDKDYNDWGGFDVWLTINQWGAPDPDHHQYGKAKMVITDWETLLEEDE